MLSPPCLPWELGMLRASPGGVCWGDNPPHTPHPPQPPSGETFFFFFGVMSLPRVGAQRPAGGMGCKTPRVRGKVGGGGCDGQRSRVEINYFFPTSGFPKGGILGVQRLRTSPPTRLTSSPGGGCSLNDGGGGGDMKRLQPGSFPLFSFPRCNGGLQRVWDCHGCKVIRAAAGGSAPPPVPGCGALISHWAPCLPPPPQTPPCLFSRPSLPSTAGWEKREAFFFFLFGRVLVLGGGSQGVLQLA